MFKSAKLIVAALAFVVAGVTIADAGTQNPPPGYRATDLLWEDRFETPKLNTNIWNNHLGDAQWGRWSAKGQLRAPYSGSNCANGTCDNVLQSSVYDPYPYGYDQNMSGNRLVGGDGTLKIIASPTNQPYFTSLGFNYGSAAVTTFGRPGAKMPREGWYLQITAKQPDSRYGAWLSLWAMAETGASEIDLQESGYTRGTTNPNNVLAVNYHNGGQQSIQDIGAGDLSADFHVYAAEYVPNKHVRIFFDHKLVKEYNASNTSGIIASDLYQVLMYIEVANKNGNGWHTVQDPVNHPGPFTATISNVQVYRLPQGGADVDTTNPTVPTSLVVVGTPTSNKVDLRWTASTDNIAVTGYNVMRNGTKIATTPGVLFSDATAQPNQTYSYQVQAYDAAGNTSASSGSLSVTTPGTGPIIGFETGSAVESTASVVVMSRAGRGNAVCTQPVAREGTLMLNSKTINDEIYWFVDFVVGCSGWVPQNKLKID